MFGGLQNPGSLCYLNAFIQILRIVSAKNKQKVQPPTLQQLLQNMDIERVCDPVPFAFTLPPPFRPGFGQQDILELMVHFFSTASPLTGSSLALSVMRTTDCSTCMSSSPHTTTESFISMSPIALTITQLLALASASTPALGYKCSQCGASDATTTEAFTPTGNFFLFHIKRFQTVQGPRGFRALKNINPVVINRDVFIAEAKFSLEAVVLHIGDMSGGHYVTDVLNSRLCYDDASIYPIPASRPALATPVLLLYRRT